MKRITKCKETTENPNDESVKFGIGYVCTEKNTVLKYLKKYSEDCVAIACVATDYVTGETLNESILSYDDGVYCWTNEEIYLFEKYNLKLNDDFIEHVLKNTK